MVNTWMEALKIYNKGKNWCLYRRGTKEYDEVRKIQDKIKRPGEKANLQKPVAKKEKVSIPKKKVKKVDAPEQESRRVEPLPCPSKDIDPDKLECKKKFLLKLVPDKNTGCPDEAKEKTQKFIERCKFGSEGASGPRLEDMTPAERREKEKYEAWKAEQRELIEKAKQMIPQWRTADQEFRDYVKTLRKYKKGENLPTEVIYDLNDLQESFREIFNENPWEIRFANIEGMGKRYSYTNDYMKGVFTRLRRKHKLPKETFDIFSEKQKVRPTSKDRRVAVISKVGELDVLAEIAKLKRKYNAEDHQRLAEYIRENVKDQKIRQKYRDFTDSIKPRNYRIPCDGEYSALPMPDKRKDIPKEFRAKKTPPEVLKKEEEIVDVMREYYKYVYDNFYMKYTKDTTPQEFLDMRKDIKKVSQEKNDKMIDIAGSYEYLDTYYVRMDKVQEQARKERQLCLYLKYLHSQYCTGYKEFELGKFSVDECHNKLKRIYFPNMSIAERRDLKRPKPPPPR